MSSDGYTVDPDGLREDANKYLPPLAEDVEDARRQVRAASQISGAFAGGSGIFDGIELYWMDILTQLGHVLEQNKDNIELDRKALCAIADRYEAQEHTTARMLGQ